MTPNQARDCVRAEQWQGDMRVCFNRAIGAGRVLATANDNLRRRIDYLEDTLRDIAAAQSIYGPLASLYALQALTDPEAPNPKETR